jgi:hypothetical protein
MDRDFDNRVHVYSLGNHGEVHPVFQLPASAKRNILTYKLQSYSSGDFVEMDTICPHNHGMKH